MYIKQTEEKALKYRMPKKMLYNVYPFIPLFQVYIIRKECGVHWLMSFRHLLERRFLLELLMFHNNIVKISEKLNKWN